MAEGGFFNTEPIPHLNGGFVGQVRTFDLTVQELAIPPSGPSWEPTTRDGAQGRSGGGDAATPRKGDRTIGEAAANLDRLRRAGLDPKGATDAELKQCTLPNLYHTRPSWLQHAHTAIDCAVWATYGCDDPLPAGVDEDAILARLLALNGEPAAGMVVA